jgi:hypothetical protein
MKRFDGAQVANGTFDATCPYTGVNQTFFYPFGCVWWKQAFDPWPTPDYCASAGGTWYTMARVRNHSTSYFVLRKLTCTCSSAFENTQNKSSCEALNVCYDPVQCGR